MSAFIDHPLRRALTDEIHARPFAALVAPQRISHLAMLSGENMAADRAALDALCRRFGVAPADSGVAHFFADLGPFSLKWERHTEFCAWTFFVAGPFDDPFAEPAIAAVPRDWLDALPGERLVGIHVAVDPRGRQVRGLDELTRYFNPDGLVASHVAGGAAEAWADFRQHPDGFGRRLIHDQSLTPRQTGRLVQRLLEIGTYHMLALLALPIARGLTAKLAAAEGELAAIIEAMYALDKPAEERRLLDRLTALAVEIERLTAQSEFRFASARAYYALVTKRIAEMREQRMEGFQTISEFMDRRLAPAMRTCESTAARLESLAQRVTRAGALLRTRVDIALEAQNQALLASMDRRAQLQLRLQQTVEGLSVAAISYYVVGLVGYALRAVESAGVHFNHDLAIGIAIPVVVGCVWYGMHRVRAHLAS